MYSSRLKRRSWEYIVRKMTRLGAINMMCNPPSSMEWRQFESPYRDHGYEQMSYSATHADPRL